MRFSLLALLLFPTLASAKVIPFAENIFLGTLSCQSAAINFEDGKLITDDRVTLPTAVCRIEKNLAVVCGFVGNDQKLVDTVLFTGGITNEKGILENDEFGYMILDMKSRRFFANNNVNLNNGKVRGARLCSGMFKYQSEVEKK